MISITSEIPDHLYESIQHHLDQHLQWDSDRLVTAALALFLLQYAQADRDGATTYLETLAGEGQHDAPQ
ncbi:MAG TPA: DUF2811 domain-containing protein [Allocoleopsis sp.]